jgi:L-amino acid N-acyltransferase YncA
MSTLLSFPRRRSSAVPRWTIEPLRRGDVAAVTELFDAMSAKSRQQRFLSPTPRLTERMVARLTDVDGESHIAVAAWSKGRCVGIARAATTAGKPSVADVAVAVADAHQGRGLGRMLVDALVAEARAVGIRDLEAMMDPTNAAARALTRTVTTTAWFEEGLVRARWSVPFAPASVA